MILTNFSLMIQNAAVSRVKLTTDCLNCAQLLQVRMDPRLNATMDMKEYFNVRIEDLTLEDLKKQEAEYVYRYRYNGGAASQVWLSHGR